METVINTTEVKTKLRQGGFTSPHIDEFCRLLADRLNTQITPLGFLMSFELMAGDVQKGVDGFTGKKIDSFIAELPIAGVIRMAMRLIARKVLPEDFANEVFAEWEGVLADSRAASLG